MNFFHSPNPKDSPKQNRKRLTQDQLRLLEMSFNYDKKLEPERKLRLAHELGLPPKQVAIWYQNKRARWKTQSLELDYQALQLRLQTALAEKKGLEKDVKWLREELERAQEMLLALNQTPQPLSSLSTSCDAGGSSSLHDDVTCSWENHEVLQLEELHACLMGANGSNWD